MKRGRPPLDRDDPSSQVHVRLPSKQYDAAARRAALERVSRAEWIRRALRHALEKRPGATGE